MKVAFALLIAQTLVVASIASAKSKPDGSDLPACTGVADVCLKANVTDPKTGKTGYQPGEWKDQTGLWANCVNPLSKSKPVPGVTGVTAAAAQACLTAFEAANPRPAKH